MTIQSKSFVKRSIVTVGYTAALLAAPALASMVSAAEAFAQPDITTISTENHQDRERYWHEQYDVPVYVPHVNTMVHQSR
jgi:hypothetical protein